MVNNKKMSKYEKIVRECFKKFNPQKLGGCVKATNWLIRKCPELRKKIINVKNNNGCTSHCIAIKPNSDVIDTQIWQFGLIVGGIKDSDCLKGIYSHEEYLKLLPRYKIGGN